MVDNLEAKKMQALKRILEHEVNQYVPSVTCLMISLAALTFMIGFKLGALFG